MLLFSKGTPKQKTAVRRDGSERTQLQCAKRFSRVLLFVILRILALRILLIMGFSRQEYWNGLSFRSVTMPLFKWNMCSQSLHCVLLCVTRHCSPPGSSVHGILQARTLEWAAMTSSGGVFPIQGLNLHCGWILYCWVTREALNGVYILAIPNIKILDFDSMRIWMINYMYPLFLFPPLPQEGQFLVIRKCFSSLPSILILWDLLSFHFRLLKLNENWINNC